MKILQVIYSLASGGAEKFVVDLSNQLASSGHDVTLCILLSDKKKDRVFNKQYLSPKVKFHSFQFNPGFSLRNIIKVEKYITSVKPDIIHCHLNVIPYFFLSALLHRNIGFFHTLHSVTQHASGVALQYQLNRFFYKNNIIHPICISQLCKQSYEQFYNLNNACCINNGRALIAPSTHILDVKDEVNALKRTSDTKVFIHIARYSIEKNQRLLVDSFNKFNEEGLDFILLIIGNGYNSNEGLALQQQSCNRIYYLGEKDNVNDYLTYSDAFCLTSIFEGLPLSLLEALSMGVTPICTSVGGISDVIQNGINGYLSNDLTVNSYMESVRDYIKKPLSKDYLKKYYNDNFSINRCSEKYESFYLTSNYMS